MRAWARSSVRRVASVGWAVRTSSSETSARRSRARRRAAPRRAARRLRRAIRAVPRSSLGVLAPAAQPVVLLGGVGELEVQAEGAQHATLVVGRERPDGLAHIAGSPTSRERRAAARIRSSAARNASPSCSTRTLPSSEPSSRTSRRSGPERLLVAAMVGHRLGYLRRLCAAGREKRAKVGAARRSSCSVRSLCSPRGRPARSSAAFARVGECLARRLLRIVAGERGAVRCCVGGLDAA